MLDDIIQNAAKLMREQAAAYGRLKSACDQLGPALVSGQPELIESLTRAGEGELLKMRVRLVLLMSALAIFADEHAGADGPTTLSAETRASFREASNGLLRGARDFQRTQARTSALAINGATFAAAGIERCGVLPITYRAPYARHGEAR